MGSTFTRGEKNRSAGCTVHVLAYLFNDSSLSWGLGLLPSVLTTSQVSLLDSD